MSASMWAGYAHSVMQGEVGVGRKVCSQRAGEGEVKSKGDKGRKPVRSAGR